MQLPSTSLSRRSLIGIGATALLAGAAGSAASLNAPAHGRAPGRVGHRGAFKTSLAFDDPDWNRDTWARLLGNMEFGTPKYGWYGGVVLGYRDGERMREICGFEGFSAARLFDMGDGRYAKVLREIGLYTDLATGDVLDTMVNPYTDERVPVVHIANDPFNHVIANTRPAPPRYGGLNTEKPSPLPLRFPWRITRKDTVTLAIDVHLFYPSALQPDKWPRESSGASVEVSEMFRYVIDRAEIENPTLTSLEATGTWTRVTPWLPWMLMGQAPGHCVYQCTMGAFDTIDMLAPKIRTYAERHYPNYFEPPKVWEEPSLSSLELYARQQKPAAPASSKPR